MKYHLDRRVVLTPESKLKNLYTWSLNEMDAGGQPVGRDLIPWEWSLYFEATELTLVSFLDIESMSFRAALDDDPSIRRGRTISAKLRPSSERGHRTSYSMLGTDRRDVQFNLSIQMLEDADTTERCQAKGLVSYTADNDFRDETCADIVDFYLYVRRETFEEYASIIAAGAVDDAVLRVGHVAGFYSDWSPSISTDQIKILTRRKEHEVEVPASCDIDPPRLDKIGEAHFHLRRTVPLGSAAALSNQQPAPSVDTVSYRDIPPSDATAQRTVNLLSSLRVAAWTVAALLVVLVFK